MTSALIHLHKYQVLCPRQLGMTKLLHAIFFSLLLPFLKREIFPDKEYQCYLLLYEVHFLHFVENVAPASFSHDISVYAIERSHNSQLLERSASFLPHFLEERTYMIYGTHKKCLDDSLKVLVVKFCEKFHLLKLLRTMF